MARLLALEWDSREARVVLARRGARSVVIERAFSIDLGSRAEGATAAEIEANVGNRLAGALEQYRVGRAETLVAVGRTNIELRLLSVPPAPEDELPDIVRMQAVRQFATLGDDWPLDFIPLPGTADGSISVLAAAISPELVEQIRQTCDKADLAPKRLVLRPVAAASLLMRRGGSSRCRLMIEQLSDEADLTVLVGQNVVFMRTVRVGAHDDAEQQARWLLGEIRRTIAAAQNQLGGRGVEQIVLAGDGTSHAALKEQIESQLSLPVELFEPFAGLALDGDLANNLPERPGSFAPLLGMLLDEAEDIQHAIDFLHPRKRRPPVSQRRRLAVIAGCAAAVVLLGAGTLWWQYSSLGKQIQELNTRSNNLKKDQKQASEILAKAEILDKWAAADVAWLDEMHYVSDRFPAGDKAIVTQFTALVRPNGGGGVIFLDSAVTEASLIAQLEGRLRSEKREVRGSGGLPADNQGAYLWAFRETITVNSTDGSAAGDSSDEEELSPIEVIDMTEGDAADGNSTEDQSTGDDDTPDDQESDGATADEADNDSAAPAESGTGDRDGADEKNSADSASTADSRGDTP